MLNYHGDLPAVAMTIIVNEKTRQLIPSAIRRKAGIKTGDKLEIIVSGGIITILPKLPAADDEYTTEHRRVVDAGLAKADEDIRAGRVYGPFDSADRMIASMQVELRKRAAAKRAKRSR
jgi:AbrB family looped-hinge helix DNA binding protein